MTLRSKLALALAPVVLGMLVTSMAAGLLLKSLGRSAERILEDNYRSVLAVQRMTQALSELDESALFAVAGRGGSEGTSTETARLHFEQQLRVQESNITEASETEATLKLREAWSEYLRVHGRFRELRAEEARREQYFAALRPASVAVRRAGDAILAMNQDAMVRKSDEAKQRANRFLTFLIAAAALAFLVAFYASATIASRLLRPLSVLAQATRRLGAGDLEARARVEGSDEIAGLAADFNAMAERLKKYRASSLGELLEAQRASQATIDSLPDPVLVLGTEGQFLHVNHAAELLLGAGLESGTRGLAPAVREIIDRTCRHVVSGKGPYVPRGLDEAVRVATPEADRHFLPRGAPVYADAGAIVGTTIVLQDVGRLLRFEELRNDMVATVAHEFRTPLTSLRMAIHLLTEQRIGPLTEKQADLVFAAREDLDRLQSTVDELLDLSRIQAGRMELATAPAEVEALVLDAVEAQHAQGMARGVDLRSEVLPGLGHVLVDAERIKLVFANLLANAIRHSRTGDVVSIRAAPTNAHVRFEVVDSGPGIAPENQQAVFEKYFQAPDGPPGGAGLGLFIAREIVLAHGGDIGVESALGKGATFWFTLERPEEPSGARG